MNIQGVLDTRFSEAAEPLDWATVDRALASAELYWITTVRADGRPHVTPLVGVWLEDRFVFCTGPAEQKARNLGHRDGVVVTTGANTWNSGLDVVVEGRAERVKGLDRLVPLAAAYRAKYGDEWAFRCDEDGFCSGDHSADGHAEDHADVYVVRAVKVIAFGKSPHAQTTFTLSPK